MIRVGFTIIGGKTNWMGGINYLKNILYAISQLETKTIHPVLFLGNNVSNALVNEFEAICEIKKYSVFDRFSINWFADSFLRDIFQINPIINNIIIENDIQVFSHSYIYGRDLKCKTINWIPDFQHFHLPHMFSFLNLHIRDYRLKLLSKYSDLVILSSHDAFNDFKLFSPKYIHKGRVVHFVSQVGNFEIKSRQYIEEKYYISGNYFFLPNQFWVHKNHLIVFEAIKLLKQRDVSVLLLCSGEINDTRDSTYSTKIKKYILDNSLNDNIYLLGKITYTDVLLLMYYSTSVINPSFFEGWSSTVEESKAMGKDMILSNISVHLEQANDVATFFDPTNANQLASILENKIKFGSNTYQITDLKSKTIDFANQYSQLFDELNL